MWPRCWPRCGRDLAEIRSHRVRLDAQAHEPVGRVEDAERLFEECYARVLGSVVANDAALLRQARGGAVHFGPRPSVSNRDTLAFNALLYAMRQFIRLMHSLDRAIETALVLRQPLDLRTVSYV